MTRSRSAVPCARHISLISAVALAAAAATACSAQTSSTADQASVVQANVQTSITWGACPPLATGTTRDPREKCGTVTVPLNYQDPNGKTITIAVSEIATAKPGKMRGYLLLNPGGPALPGLDMPSTMAPTLPASVLDEYGLIGFDPRGVGHSTPMSCGLPSSSDAAPFPYPAADGSIRQNIATARTIAGDCAKIGNELQYFTTASTARDMDRIRLALGAAKISYWGQSYGSYLGAVYTTLFPQHTDRMVLEGNVDPNDVWSQQIQLWNQGMNDRFPDAAGIALAPTLTTGFVAIQQVAPPTALAEAFTWTSFCASAGAAGAQALAGNLIAHLGITAAIWLPAAAAAIAVPAAILTRRLSHPGLGRHSR